MQHLFEVEFFDGMKITAVGTSCQDIINNLMERMHTNSAFITQVEWRVRSIRYIKEIE